MQQLTMGFEKDTSPPKKHRRLPVYSNPDIEYIGVHVEVTLERCERVGFGKGSVGLRGVVVALADGTPKTEWCVKIRLDEASYVRQLDSEKKYTTEAWGRANGVDENRELWICAGMLERI